MKIVIAPDSFKESVSALRAAHLIRDGLAAVLHDAVFDCIPMADGGEGTLAALVAASNGELISLRVSDPLGRTVNAHYGLLGDGRTAVIECAQASGLGLLDAAARDARRASTYGSGELVRAALAHPIDRLIIGLGGSATNDGGAGLCQALGVRFLDHDGLVIERRLGGGDLAQVASFDVSAVDPRLSEVDIEIACDVDNPLLGADGASATFGPQKGADPATVAELERNLAHFYDVVERTLGVRVRDRAGAGAAGGLGAALLAFFDARLRPGIDIVEQAAELRARLSGASVVITGEGRLDAQTARGKAPAGVARIARELGIPVIALGGSLADDAEDLLGDSFDAIEACVCRPASAAEALAHAETNLLRAARRIGYWLRFSMRLGKATHAG